MSNPNNSKNSSVLIDWAGDRRVMLAIVFTDIVSSTKLGVELGDERMIEVRRAHFDHSENLLRKYSGRQVKTIGDSVMAVFRSVGSALDYAYALHTDPGAAELRTHGVRAGIHNGEVDVIENDIFGTDVAFAARVAHAIEGAEIWMSANALEAVSRARPRHQEAMRWLQHDNVELKGLGTYTLWSLKADPAVPVAPVAADNPPTTPVRPAPPRPEPAAGVVAASPAGPVAQRPKPDVAKKPVPPNARTVFVARPADDMGQAYIRIVDELTNRGIRVVPDKDIPTEDGAASFIDDALAASELSVHLLGNKRGYAPAEEDPIVKLQLSRAAKFAQAKGDGVAGAPGFRRIIWAPKFLDGAESEERDPLDVLAKVGELLPDDKLLGENLVKFIETLQTHLSKTRPPAPVAPDDLPPGAKIFIDHAIDDLDYATELAIALAEMAYEPRLPTLEGKPSLVNAQNRREMEECVTIALCWGNTTEAWVRSEAIKLDQWRRQGGQDQIKSTLLAVPPSHRIKDRWLRIKLPGVDKAVNMTAIDKPSTADIARWLGRDETPTGGGGGD